MPRPPVLPTIDWASVFESGIEYAEWIKDGESPDNRERMESIRQAIRLDPPMAAYVAALTHTVHVIAIAEDWCGDVVRHVPMLEALAEAASKVRVRYIAREQHPEVFARFLTNGGEAIPKFVFLSEDFVECGNWGPMPEACRELVARGKACGDVPVARKKVSALYDADPDGRVVVRELFRLIEIAACSAP